MHSGSGIVVFYTYYKIIGVSFVIVFRFCFILILLWGIFIYVPYSFLEVFFYHVHALSLKAVAIVWPIWDRTHLRWYGILPYCDVLFIDIDISYQALSPNRQSNGLRRLLQTCRSRVRIPAGFFKKIYLSKKMSFNRFRPKTI